MFRHMTHRTYLLDDAIDAYRARCAMSRNY